MRIHILLLLVLLPQNSLATVGSDSPQEAREAPPVALGQGEQRAIAVPGLNHYSLGSAIIHAKSVMNHNAATLLIKGMTPGQTDLWIWKDDGSKEHRRVFVEKIQASEIKPALLKSLSELEEVEITYTEHKVTLRGLVHTTNELRKLELLDEYFNTDVEDLTQTDPELLASQKRKIELWLKNSNYQNKFQLELVAGELWLRGSVGRTQEVTALQRRLKSLFPKLRTDLQALPDNAPTIHFKVFLIELQKRGFRSLGLTWPGSIPGAFHVSSAGIQSQLPIDLTLEALENEGTAKILSKPELVVRAPGEAELFSGGEIPITEKSHFFSNTVWKQFGLKLALKVTNTTGERIRLDISTEVSRLDPSLANEDKIPGIQANRMKTQVDAHYGAPLFLSGLLQQSVREQARGLPFLRQIPVLGALFGSQDYMNEKSELVAILVPNLSPPEAPMEQTKIFSPDLPKGPVPAPRNWVSPSQASALKESPNYPWNALQ